MYTSLLINNKFASFLFEKWYVLIYQVVVSRILFS